MNTPLPMDIHRSPDNRIGGSMTLPAPKYENAPLLRREKHLDRT